MYKCIVEKVGVAYSIVKKLVKSPLVFDHIRKTLIKASITRAYQIKNNPIIHVEQDQKTMKPLEKLDSNYLL